MTSIPMHCVSAGLGSHCPGVLVCSVSAQVLVVGPEGMSPSSHWKVAIAPTVVPDTIVLVELGGNSGTPQSTVWIKLQFGGEIMYYTNLYRCVVLC